VSDQRTIHAPHECLDAETIAAFLDGRLSRREKAAVTAHLADCESCHFVFAESARARLVDARGSHVLRPWQWVAIKTAGAGVALAAAASLVLIVQPQWAPRWWPARSEVGELVSAVGSNRTVEPRLTGGFAYGPLRGPVRAGASIGEIASPDVRIAAARIEKSATERRTPQNLGALGVAFLLTGKPTEAVSALESATRDAPDEAELWSDLAAAYLTRAERERHLDDLAKAVNAADRATRIAPSIKEAWFNRALAIERIGGLRDEAKKAWEQYLTVDSQSGWAEEARSHLARLSSQSRVTWKQQKDATVQAVARGDRAGVLKAAQQFPLALREYLMTDVLPLWAEAQLNGRKADARASLRRARLVADALADATTDPMMRDAVAQFEASADLPQTANLFAGAYRRFAEAKQLFDQNRLESSRPLLEEAAARLRAVQCPLWAEARQNIGTAWFREGQYDRAVPVLREVASFAERRGYAQIFARTRRLFGMIWELRSDLAASENEFRSSLALFTQGRDEENVAFVHNLLAENYRLLGQTRESWQQHDQALALLEKVSDIRVSNPILTSTATTCLTDELPGTALVFLDAILDEAIQSHDAPSIVSAYLRRARILYRLGAFERAIDDLNHSREPLAAILDPSIARANETEVLVAEGELLQKTSPLQAIKALTVAMTWFEKSASASRLVNLYLARGRAYEQLANYDAAEADYRQGIAIFEREHGRLPQERFRTSHYDAQWDLFVQMMTFQVARRGRPDLALSFAERARARTLLEAASNNVPREFTQGQIQTVLPRHVAVVSYLVLQDRLLAWVVTRTTANFADLPVRASRLASLIEAHQSDLLRDAKLSANAASVQLYRSLVQPIASRLDPDCAIVFVPDGPLHAVSFAALVDPQSGRYLIQDHAVGVAPSLALSVDGGGFDQTASHAPRTALVIGNPRRDSSFVPAVADLNEAEAEAREVAGAYPKAVLLTRDAATKQRFFYEAARHEVLHFAGHAIQNPEFPWLSRLLFASGSPEADSGTVFAHEIAAQRLARVRLVVLAACRTATGPTLRGEGVLNLARPFMVAGVPSVIATLWDVNDRASRHLLTAFHRDVAAGKTPVEALRRAQLSLLSSDDPVLRTPASWAAFVAIGATSQVGN
jgi:CHAT domain-containing protein